jgi:peptidoglycan/xylan/chitin deacetylase (PgdA/CDA1 family)
MEKWATMLLTGLFLGAAFLIGSPAVKAMVNGKKQVMLTFDDGPHPDYTPRILDILDQHQVKAIFFVVGQEVDHNATIVEEIHQRGHLLGNHTYSHRNVTTIPRETLLEELAATDALIENITGYNPAFFRPPGVTTILTRN